MSNVYGIDTTKEVSSKMVRDAIVECFFLAHSDDAGFTDKSSPLARDYCTKIVKKAFVDTGSDFNNPTKESLDKVIVWLADFAKLFRTSQVISKHMGEIRELIKKIK